MIGCLLYNFEDGLTIKSPQNYILFYRYSSVLRIILKFVFN